MRTLGKLTALGLLLALSVQAQYRRHNFTAGTGAARPPHAQSAARIEATLHFWPSSSTSSSTARPRSASATSDAFRKTYNEERPHEALGQKPPSTVYQRSVRPYPDRLQEPEYPLHDDVRRVSVSGHVPFGKRNSGVFLSTALSGELVGLRELDDGRWLVSFLDLDLGVVDPSSRHLAALPQRVEAIPSIEASTEDLFVSSGPYAEKPIRNAPSLLNGKGNQKVLPMWSV